MRSLGIKCCTTSVEQSLHSIGLLLYVVRRQCRMPTQKTFSWAKSLLGRNDCKTNSHQPISFFFNKKKSNRLLSFRVLKWLFPRLGGYKYNHLNISQSSWLNIWFENRNFLTSASGFDSVAPYSHTILLYKWRELHTRHTIAINCSNQPSAIQKQKREHILTKWF